MFCSFSDSSQQQRAKYRQSKHGIAMQRLNRDQIAEHKSESTIYKTPEFAFKVAKWVQQQGKAVTAHDIAGQFSLEISQARKLLHYMMKVPGIVACLDWGYPQDTTDKEHTRPTRLFSIVTGSVL